MVGKWTSKSTVVAINSWRISPEVLEWCQSCPEVVLDVLWKVPGADVVMEWFSRITRVRKEKTWNDSGRCISAVEVLNLSWRWWDIVKIVLNLRVTEKTGNILTS